MRRDPRLSSPTSTRHNFEVMSPQSYAPDITLRGDPASPVPAAKALPGASRLPGCPHHPEAPSGLASSPAAGTRVLGGSQAAGRFRVPRPVTAASSRARHPEAGPDTASEAGPDIPLLHVKPENRIARDRLISPGLATTVCLVPASLRRSD